MKIVKFCVFGIVTTIMFLTFNIGSSDDVAFKFLTHFIALDDMNVEGTSISNILIHSELKDSVFSCGSACVSRDCASYTFNDKSGNCNVYSEKMCFQRHLTNISIGIKYLQATDENDECHHLYPNDCEDIKGACNHGDGIYCIYPKYPRFSYGYEAYCEMSTHGGGWTVFQRRLDGSEVFLRNWTDYKQGFGDRNREFWLGNDALHDLTSEGNYSLRVDLEDFRGQTRYATYDVFAIADEVDAYRLKIAGYNGTAGDSFGLHDGYQFTTQDRDNDIHPFDNCARMYLGSWWYFVCHWAHLNGEYNNTVFGQGVVWKHWNSQSYILKATRMMIRKCRY